MANFNFGIDCASEDSAEDLKQFLDGLDFYIDGLDSEDERVSVISKQGLLEELKKYSSDRGARISVEVWPEDMEYDDADESGDLEVHDFGG